MRLQKVNNARGKRHQHMLLGYLQWIANIDLKYNAHIHHNSPTIDNKQ